MEYPPRNTTLWWVVIKDVNGKAFMRQAFGSRDKAKAFADEQILRPEVGSIYCKEEANA